MRCKGIMLLLLRAIPEAIGVIGAGLVLAGRRVSVKDILITGVIGGVIACVIRLLPLKFGIHSILVIMVLIVIQRLFLKLNLKTAIVATLLGVALLGILEYISLNIWITVNGITFESLLADEYMKLIAGLPSLLGLILVSFGGELLKNR